MDLSHLLAYFGALAIGMVLGLIGGGGSILTVPILVYLLGINPVTATAYSLFVVGTSSLVGAVNSMRKKMVAFRTAFVFSVPAFTAVYLTRKYLIPALPETLVRIGQFDLTKEIGIMLFFASVMILAAVSMLRRDKISNEGGPRKFRYGVLGLQGLGVGLVTGLVGAGGGFLIIPALVLLAKLPMKRAVATSLFIIAMNSLIGFMGDVQNQEIDWWFLLSFTALAIVGIFLGGYLNRFVNSRLLRKMFGGFILFMGAFIIWMEIG